MEPIVFPAWAGMNRYGDPSRHDGPGVPRVGGDEPGIRLAAGCQVEVFPAWAGMNRVETHT